MFGPPTGLALSARRTLILASARVRLGLASWGVGRIWCLVAAWIDARRIWLRKKMQGPAGMGCIQAQVQVWAVTNLIAMCPAYNSGRLYH